MPGMQFIRPEAIWIEAIRGLPESGVSLDQVWRNVDFRSGGNEIVAQLVIRQRFARHQPTGWIQTQCFLNYLARVGKFCQMAKFGD